MSKSSHQGSLEIQRKSFWLLIQSAYSGQLRERATWTTPTTLDLAQLSGGVIAEGEALVGKMLPRGSTVMTISNSDNGSDRLLGSGLSTLHPSFL